MGGSPQVQAGPLLALTEEAGTPGAPKPEDKQPMLGARWALPGSAWPYYVTLDRAAPLRSSLPTPREAKFGSPQGLPPMPTFL